MRRRREKARSLGSTPDGRQQQCFAEAPLVYPVILVAATAGLLLLLRSPIDLNTIHHPRRMTSARDLRLAFDR